MQKNSARDGGQYRDGLREIRIALVFAAGRKTRLCLHNKARLRESYGVKVNMTPITKAAVHTQMIMRAFKSSGIGS